jgi:alkaline phosphatase D
MKNTFIIACYFFSMAFFVWHHASNVTMVQKVPRLTHGPLVAAVTPSSAKIWVRAVPESSVRIGFRQAGFPEQKMRFSPVVTSARRDDFTATVQLQGLEENRTYQYSVFLDGKNVTPDLDPVFSTFPVEANLVRIALLADLRLDRPFYREALESLAGDAPDFVIILGDWDHGNPLDLAAMRRMHKTTRSHETDAGGAFFDLVLCRFPVVHTWDDHDYGDNNSDKTFAGRKFALRAHDEYWPTYDRPNPASGIWHCFPFAGLLDVFVLDLRSQRDPDSYNLPGFVDDGCPGSNRDALRNDPARSMLDGDASQEKKPRGQKDWLKTSLGRSRAPWKLVVSSVTWNPTTIKDDAWWDFSAEQKELQTFIEKHKVEGVLVVSGDLHTQGAMDDGRNAGLPEFSVPAVNLSQNKPTCTLHGSTGLRYTDCGQWSHGLNQDEAAAYGMITLTPDRAWIENKDRFGRTVSKMVLHRK